MSLFHRKPIKPRMDFDTRELRRAADRITGWSWVGDGSLDPQRLLRDAAIEIERLTSANIASDFYSASLETKLVAKTKALDVYTRALNEIEDYGGALCRSIARQALAQSAKE